MGCRRLVWVFVPVIVHTCVICHGPTTGKGKPPMRLSTPYIPSKGSAHQDKIVQTVGRLRGGLDLKAGPYNALSDAVGLASQISTPAALLAGAALSTILGGPPDDAPPSQTLHTVHVTLAYITFGLQLTAVIGSSMTCMQLLAGGFSPEAHSAVELLYREFEVPFLCARVTFVLGVITFVCTIITRSWILYNKESEKHNATIISSILGFITLIIMKLLNPPLADFPPFLQMLGRFGKIVWKEVLWKWHFAAEVASVSLLAFVTQNRRVQDDRSLWERLTSRAKREVHEFSAAHVNEKPLQKLQVSR